MGCRRVATISVVAAKCWAVGGCAGGGGEVVHAEGLAILVGEKSGDAADALLSGTLADVSGCLGVDNTVVVWPHGTRVVQEHPLTVAVPGLGRVGIGDEVELGGGVALDQHPAPPTAGDLDIAGVTVPAACTTHNVWVGG
jgi:hypothetical protein